MRRQAEIAIDTCDVILFFTDGRTGMTADDEDVATMLRKSRKPVILVVNKVDYQGMNDNIYDFYALGLGDPFPISATNMLGLGRSAGRNGQAFPAGRTDRGRGRAHHSNCRRRPPERRQIQPREPDSRAGTLDGFRHCGHDARRDRHARLCATASATTSSTPPASAASAPSRKNPSSVTASCARWPPSAAATWR